MKEASNWRASLHKQYTDTPLLPSNADDTIIQQVL